MNVADDYIYIESNSRHKMELPCIEFSLANTDITSKSIAKQRYPSFALFSI